MSTFDFRSENFKPTQPRHASVRHWPALHHFGLAETAVREGKAMWLPMPGSCCSDDESMPCRSCSEVPDPDDDEIEVFVDEPFAPDDNPVIDEAEFAHPDADDAADWDDDHVWTVTKPVGPLHLTMVEMVEWEGERFRSWNTSLGDLLADRMELLANLMRLLDATTPETFLDRRSTLLAHSANAARARRIAAGVDA